MKKTEANQLLEALLDMKPRAAEQWRYKAGKGSGGISRLGNAVLCALEDGRPFSILNETGEGIENGPPPASPI